MKTIGLDIGTTTVSAVLLENGRYAGSLTGRNTAKTENGEGYRLQDPAAIEAECLRLLEELSAESADRIALTGQMHGIVYVDEYGNACADAVSWQDPRGDEPFCDGVTYCGYIRGKTGYPVATGYGLVTLFHDLRKGTVPQNAVRICTIPDYIAMRLSGRRTPFIHESMAHSLGLFDLCAHGFDVQALAALDISPAWLPEVTGEAAVLGRYRNGPEVIAALGDNQASVYGACAGISHLLANIGTGSQISMIVGTPARIPGLEARPYVDGQYLLNGSALCGGSAYDVLKNLVSEVLEGFGSRVPDDLLTRLNQAALTAGSAGGIRVDTRFRGTREDPSLRGMISGISVDNFTLGHLAYAFAEGVCRELADFLRLMPETEEKRMSVSGNAVRNSELYRKVLGEIFADKELILSPFREEAAGGAALYAYHQAAEGGV